MEWNEYKERNQAIFFGCFKIKKQNVSNLVWEYHEKEWKGIIL